MKIVICCEGPTDVGPLTALIRKCSPLNNLDIDCKIHDELKGKNLLKIRLSKKNRQDNKRINRVAFIMRSFQFATLSKCKHIGLHQDSGHQDFKEVYQGIHKDFNAVLPGSIKRLAIVPKEMIESWLLADVTAINSLGDGTIHVDQSPNPETLWGNKDDPESNYPKNYLKRNLEKLGVEFSNDTYARIAENTNIEILKRRCPISFGQFCTDMQSFIDTGTAS
jgi:hypothetical protein